jgi:long-chain fatty acid transport protein
MKLKIVSLLTLSVALPTGVFGLGIRLPDQDAFATGRGEAFVATADNPSAIYYNPAGITQLEGQNARAGFYGLYLNDHYNGQGASVDTHDKIQGAPQLYYTYGFQDVPLTLGLGLYAPYGLAIEWPNTAPFASAGYKGSLTYLTLNPVLAWKVCSNLSIAAGITVNYGDLDLSETIGFFPGSQFRYHGSDFTPGANAGVLWQPITELSLGASYRSETRMKFSGTSSLTGTPFDGSVHADTPFDFPQWAVAGISYRPTPKWNFEFDVDWTDWNQLKTVTISATPPAGAAVPLAFNWQDSFFYEFGATYYFENDWHVSGGYIYSTSSMTDSSFNPVVPDSVRHIWSVGVGSKYKNLSWDASYQLAWGPDRTINIPGNPANGTYEFLSHAISVSVGYHF